MIMFGASLPAHSMTFLFYFILFFYVGKTTIKIVVHNIEPIHQRVKSTFFSICGLYQNQIVT
jgi:hypothetical protein